MFAKPEFVRSKINLMPNDNSKAKVLHMYKNNIFPFIYDVKTTIPGEFLDLALCDISNFCLETKIAIKLQVYSRNFKMKGKEKNIRYCFNFIGLYKPQKVKILLPLISEKRQKEANKFIAIPPRTKNI